MLASVQPTVEPHQAQESQDPAALDRPRVLSQQELASKVHELAGHPAQWVSRVRLDAEGRWYEQIHVDGCYEIWLISWLPGQATGFHDHGEANGAFSVVWGTLDESVAVGGHGAAVTVRPVTQGVVRAFGPHYVHDVRNATESVAVSIHAYSPPLTAMTRYQLTQAGLVPSATETQANW
jgi:predicted metal-dependent enzyme (double-stranded beta helix superfamily)